MASALGGPSGQSKKGRSKKALKNAPNTSKLRRISEKQTIEALERDAINFVRGFL
jgi:hypothetical protein